MSFEMFMMFEMFDPSTSLRNRSHFPIFQFSHSPVPVIPVILVVPVVPFFLLQSFRFANDPEADAFDVGIPPDTLGLLGICL